VEKLEITAVPHRSPNDLTFAELFARPFGQITIQRPLQHFNKALGMEPGMASEPSLEIMVRLLTSHATHKAMLRQHLGDADLRNFENLIRGKNTPTKRTISTVAKHLEVPGEEIINLIHGQKEGPLLPQYLKAIQMLEGFLSLMYAKMTAFPIPCPNCGTNVLDDTEAFWGKQPHIGLNPPEYLFVERCLTALIGWRTIRCMFIQDVSPVTRCLGPLNPDPFEPDQYPVANWLQTVRDAYRCSDNLDLEKHLANLPLGKGPATLVNQHQMNKWACGENLIPLDIGKSMIRNLPNAIDFERALIEARAIVFLQEFVNAASFGVSLPKSVAVRTVIYERAGQLADKLRLSFRHALQRKNTRG
jgi:hypothetical protein